MPDSIAEGARALLDEEEGDDGTDMGYKAKGGLSSGERGERGATVRVRLSETEPDHDFGFGALRARGASFDRSYGMSARLCAYIVVNGDVGGEWRAANDSCDIAAIVAQ